MARTRASSPGVPEAVAAALDRLAPAGSLGLAVSGGGDSVALLLAASDWARARGRVLAVATVDHGLRPESAGEAAFVARLSAGHGLAHRTLKISTLAPGNLNARAREARLGLLADWAREEGLAAVLLGHTLDDQAETVLMRLGRASGADGLSAMAEASRRLGTLWLRPMLGLRRAALRDWLAGRGAEWIDDPTNEDRAHQRVRIRQLLDDLAEAGIAPEAIAASAARLARQREVLDRVTDDLLAAAVEVGPAGEVWVAQAPFRAAGQEIAGRLAARIVQAITGAAYPPRGAPLAKLVSALRGTPAAGGGLGGVLARPARGGRILFCREPAEVEPETAIGPGGTVWDGRWRIGPAQDPDVRIGALGRSGIRALPAPSRPALWDSLPHDVRLTLPALRRRGVLLGLAWPRPEGPEPPESQPNRPFAHDLVRERLLSARRTG